MENKRLFLRKLSDKDLLQELDARLYEKRIELVLDGSGYDRIIAIQTPIKNKQLYSIDLYKSYYGKSDNSER